MLYKALSVVQPAGTLIASGRKVLEIRQWKPDLLPLFDLLIVENKHKLGSSTLQEDPDGVAVALVDILEVNEWQQHEIDSACASYWEPGWLAWEITNVRKINSVLAVPAKLRIYQVELPFPLP